MHTPDIHKNIKFAGVFKIRVSLYEYRQEGQVTFVNDEAVFFFCSQSRNEKSPRRISVFSWFVGRYSAPLYIRTGTGNYPPLYLPAVCVVSFSEQHKSRRERKTKKFVKVVRVTPEINRQLRYVRKVTHRTEKWIKY